MAPAQNNFGGDPVVDASTSRWPPSRMEHAVFLLLGVSVGLGVAVASKQAVVWSAAALACLAFLFLCIRSFSSWVYACLTASLVVPPLYPSVLGGDVPVYVPNLLFVVGALTMLFRHEEYGASSSRTIQASLFFVMAVLVSLPFAFWISGPAEGLQSLLRFVLILQPFLVYAWIRGFPCFRTSAHVRTFVKFLLWAGAASALYGIVDFYEPIPIPHPFADQYIYLDFRHIRRAQGVFYEASSFGNMCAFFLCLALCLLFSGRKGLSLTDRVLLCLGTGIFTSALFLSYSRGSWLAVMVAVPTFLVLQQQLRPRVLIALSVVVGGFVLLVYQFSPDVVANFFNWRLGTLADLWDDPNSATSGRWENWATLLRFFADRPWLLLFGIGYKTIPHTGLFGQAVVADNGYMSLLFETGILGLTAFLWLSAAILNALQKCRKTPVQVCQLYGAFLLAFWYGELAQMLTGDIFTYWRNLSVF
ncbi:MAG: O-antigen ligase family protein, partial [Acidobacteria bacterium]|nr:O-antigen ligase family protein [Acidobacteriota bacterium]